MNQTQILEVERILKNLVYQEDDGKTFNLFSEAMGLFTSDPEVIQGVTRILEEINAGNSALLEMETKDFIESLNI